MENFTESKVDTKTQNEEDSFIAKSELVQYDFDEDTTCGFWLLKGQWIQKLASKKSFLVVHALTGMIYTGEIIFGAANMRHYDPLTIFS